MPKNLSLNIYTAHNLKNLMKNLLKNSALFLTLLLFGCQSVNQQMKSIDQKISQTINDKIKPIFTPAPTPESNKLESRPLNVEKSSKKKVKVALFLPFSGKNKELGWHLFNTATLSLFDNDLNNNIELVLIDSKDDDKDTAKAFKEVISKDIKVVIGPIFSQSVEAIEKDAKSRGITAISLSNNHQLIGKTNNDGGVFLAGVMLESQIEKVVSYAILQGKTNFSIIAPNNQYGLTITNILKTTVKAKDGTFITSEFYEPSSKDLDKIANRVVSSFSISSQFMKKGSKDLKKNVTLKDSDRSYTQVIMIPESGKILSKIVEAIKRQNKDEREFQLIGTNQWDDISTLNDNNLRGAWFASAESNKFRDFEKSYYHNFNKFPPRISSIVYDSVAAVAALVDRKKGQNLEIKDFTSYNGYPTNGFDGIDGQFRFLPNGFVQRNLATLQVGNSQFDTIDKPADKFLKY